MKYAVCNELFGAVSLREAASMAARRGLRGLELAPCTVFGDFSAREVERGIADIRWAAAVLLAALFMHGYRPGPLLRTESPGFIYGISVYLVLASIAMWAPWSPGAPCASSG
ncbi:MAG: tripartite tricarboxylate transporter permease [Candidatus Accumulibacter sp.]|jgi:hypothetical protein|nr:tripartite tricarboxylate transporter permease [Accumulibacter sp.]